MVLRRNEVIIEAIEQFQTSGPQSMKNMQVQYLVLLPVVENVDL